MATSIDNPEAAFMALADPQNPQWAEAFAYLANQPETAQVIMDTFKETLQQMGVEPSGTSPATGEPSYSLADIARAMEIPAADLEVAMEEAAAKSPPMD
ncbi:MAG: hypothetical protein ABFS23_03855 [Pseudomonadota bacterium]